MCVFFSWFVMSLADINRNPVVLCLWDPERTNHSISVAPTLSLHDKNSHQDSELDLFLLLVESLVVRTAST